MSRKATLGVLEEIRGHHETQDSFDTEDAMLVLSRKLNEKIVINGNIVVTVVKIDRNQVRIGIEAPGEIPVYREEILPMSVDAGRDAELMVMS